MLPIIQVMIERVVIDCYNVSVRNDLPLKHLRTIYAL